MIFFEGKLKLLRIKRVPTIVSNYQKEEGDASARVVGGCGKNCLKECTVVGGVC